MMKYQAFGRSSDGSAAKAEPAQGRLPELIAELLASVHGGDCPPYTSSKHGSACRTDDGPVQD